MDRIIIIIIALTTIYALFLFFTFMIWEMIVRIQNSNYIYFKYIMGTIEKKAFILGTILFVIFFGVMSVRIN